jgi:hypothetical protein
MPALDHRILTQIYKKRSRRIIEDMQLVVVATSIHLLFTPNTCKGGKSVDTLDPFQLSSLVNG